MSNKKLLGAAAFAVALTAGAGIGALIGSPTASFAQESDDSTTTAPASPDSDTPPADPGDCDHGPGGPGARPLGTAATALGMTKEELRDALDADTSIADVAAERNVDVQKVIDALVAEATARIDQKVADGDITAEQAAARKAELTERITALVNHDGPPPRHHRHGPPPAGDTAAATTDA